MKKHLALIIALFTVIGICITLAACNGGKTPQGTTTGTDKITTEATDKQTTETTEPTTPDTTEPTTPDTTEPTTPDTTEPVTPDTTEPTTPDTTEPVTPDTTEPTTPDTTEPTTPDTTESTTPDTTEPTTPDTTEPTTPDTTEPTTPDTTEPTTPDTTESTTPDTTEPTTPDTTEPTTPDTTEPTTPDTTEPTTPDTTEPSFDLTIEEAIDHVSSMNQGTFTQDKYYVTGTITSIFIPTKGGIIISDENGNTMRITATYNEDGTVGYAQMSSKPEIGDRVVVYGVISKYGNSVQMKDGWIIDFGVPEQPDFDLTLKEAVELGNALDQGEFTEDKYYVTATVKSIYLPAKGSMIITDEDGNTIRLNVTYNEDGTLGFAQMSSKPAVGDRIVIFGYIGKYNGNVQINDGWIIEFGESETQGTEENTTDTPETTPPSPDGNEKYGNGPTIEEAGAKWEQGFFPNIKHTVDTSKAVPITAEELLVKLQDRDGENALKKGEVWIVTEPLVLESDCKYYGNGAAIIAEGGIIIKDEVGVVIKDIIIRGTLSIENSHEIIFFKVDIESAGTTVTIDNQNTPEEDRSSDITFKSTRIRGNNASVVGFADNVTIYNCYIYSHNGINIVGDNTIVQSCRIFASMNAIYVSGWDCVIRENSIETVDIGAAVTVVDSTNALVALNAIRGSQDTIKVTDSFNCSVILNSAICITGKDNTNLYVIDNRLGGYLHLENNNYLIAEDNTFSQDGLNHFIVNINNENKNGNSVTNVDERVEFGANEELLPHTNKELFVGMPRKASVADASIATSKGIGTYIEDLAREQEIIIVPPGAYASYSPITLREGQDNTKVYAYGAYQEYAETDPLKVDNLSLFFVGVNDVSIYGLTVGHTLPSSGQVRIIEKIREDNTYMLKVVADAGFLDGFTTTNPEIYHTWWPEFFLTDEDGSQKPYPEENQKTAHTTTFNYDENGEYDGTMTITLRNKGSGGADAENKTAKALWDKVEVGNVITCRINFAAHKELTGSLIYLVGCKNLTFRDTVTYGSAGGMCVFTGNNQEGISFTRQHNTTHSGRVIDKETYDRYVEIGKQYNVDMEVYEEVLEDGTVRYRGPYSRSGSVDAFHITSSKTGVNVTSSILEGMVDDGSNQKSNSSRLHGYEVNEEDGTVTLFYKNCLSSVYWSNSTHLPSNEVGFSSCRTFSKGERIYVFTPQGRTVCDTTVLEAWTEKTNGVEINETYGSVNKHLWINLYAVKVKLEDVDLEAFINPDTGEEFDLTDNGYETTNRLSVDNLSWNCCDYTLDNVMVRNGHSRGFLVKAINATYKHCTFRNVSNAGLLITIEPQYGETTIARNILIQQCLFDHVGYNYGENDEMMQSCIVIKAGSTVVSEHTLPIDNISIIGCKFTNNTQRTAIWVNSAKNITIKDNVFDPIVNETNKTRGIAVYLDTCMNVEISDNTYNYSAFNANGGSIQNVIYGTQYKNIFGTDVTNKDGTPMYPDKTNDGN